MVSRGNFKAFGRTFGADCASNTENGKKMNQNIID